MKLYHIPNIILGIKLRNKPIEFITCHLSFYYWQDETNGSMSINNQSIKDYVTNMIHGMLLIEKEDQNFGIYDNLSNTDLNCMMYSYEDIGNSIEEESAELVVGKLESIMETNLTSLLSEQNITISEISIKY